MSDKQIKVSCEMIVEKDKQVLLTLRKNIFGSGQWCFPGGHMEHGESSLVCAKRELKEEIGVEAVDIKLIAVINDTPEHQDTHYVRFVYLITKWNGEIINAEPDICEQFKWFNINNLPEPFFIGQQKVLPIYLNKIQGIEGVKVLEE